MSYQKKKRLTLLNEDLILHITDMRLGFLFLLLLKIRERTAPVSSVKVKAKPVSDALSATHWTFTSKAQLLVRSETAQPCKLAGKSTDCFIFSAINWTALN